MYHELNVNPNRYYRRPLIPQDFWIQLFTVTISENHRQTVNKELDQEVQIKLPKFKLNRLKQLKNIVLSDWQDHTMPNIAYADNLNSLMVVDICILSYIKKNILNMKQVVQLEVLPDITVKIRACY